jgi:hypothetical protein
MVYRPSVTAAVTRYYVFSGLFREGDEDLTFEEVDAGLIEVAQNSTREFAGTARIFVVELEQFDDESHFSEIIVGFTIWPFKDDDSEVVLILATVRGELEKVGFVEDDAYYIGDGPDIR